MPDGIQVTNRSSRIISISPYRILTRLAKHIPVSTPQLSHPHHDTGLYARQFKKKKREEFDLQIMAFTKQNSVTSTQACLAPLRTHQCIATHRIRKQTKKTT